MGGDAFECPDAKAMIAGSRNRLLRVVPPPPATERGMGALARPEFSEHLVTEPGLDALYARYAPYVAAIATRILGRRAEVEDVVQEVFALALAGLRRREDHREIKSWLATVTVRR